MKSTSAELMPIGSFGEGVLPRRAVSDGQFLEASDPAIHAITDFTREHPVTVSEERQIDDALADMIHLGVRAMLVMREQRIVGLITSYDIQGERPLQFLQGSNYTRHQDIRVGHIMTPWDQLLAVDWESIQSARADELLTVLEGAGMTHLLVVERHKDRSSAVVRALVSRARLTRQLRGLRRAG
ncbi:MAG: CBS domain-containing protein [Pseudomonadota bacterium]|nr:CBS domain-containing protein [Pseudomonadota bacterium]